MYAVVIMMLTMLCCAVSSACPLVLLLVACTFGLALFVALLNISSVAGLGCWLNVDLSSLVCRLGLLLGSIGGAFRLAPLLRSMLPVALTPAFVWLSWRGPSSR